MSDQTLSQRLRELKGRLRENRHEVHTGCCDDAEQAVPCSSAVCVIEYEAEQALGDAADALDALQAERDQLRAQKPKRFTLRDVQSTYPDRDDE
jgi:hypothetical protein